MAVHVLVLVPHCLRCGLQTGVIHSRARKCFLRISQHFTIFPAETGNDAQEFESLFAYEESDIVHYANPQCVYYDEISTSHSTEMNLLVLSELFCAVIERAIERWNVIAARQQQESIRDGYSLVSNMSLQCGQST